MEQNEPKRVRTVTLEEDGVIKLTGYEIRQLRGLKSGDKLMFEVVDDESFTIKKASHE